MTNPRIKMLQESYEKLPYMSQAYTQSHPNRLASLANLFQISPAPVTQCRVLELGSASGGNIIPLAWHLPQSEFVGIEISRGQAEAGQKVIEDLRITNLKILHRNILEVDSEIGTFDYIICHGVFSWVPREVQDKILQIASAHLNPRGVAYISYNTYPGWHAKEMVRNMMLYHSGHFDSLDQRLNQARATITFLADAVEKEGDRTYSLALKRELQTLNNSEDWYLYHDYLEVVNDPIYFHQFCKRADKYGLQYLAEAEFGVMFSDEFSVKTNNTLEEISQDIVQKEQYMDFLRNRSFRQTLLCHKDLDIVRHLDGDCLDALLVSSEARPRNETVDLAPQIVEKFTIREGFVIETSSPELKTALLILKRTWPKAIAFTSLLDESLAYLQKVFASDVDPQAVKKDLGRELLQCYISGAVHLATWQNDFCPEITDCPQVSPLTHYQANQDLFIVSPDHEKISLDSMSRHMVRLLNGENDRIKVLDKIQSMVDDDFLQLSRHGMPVSDSKKARVMISEKLDNLLSILLKSRLLVA